MIHAIYANLLKELFYLKNKKISVALSIANAFFLFFALYIAFNNFGFRDSSVEISIFIINYILWYFSLSAITEPGWNILSETHNGTLEQWWLSPFPFWFILLSKMFSNVFINGIRTLILMFCIYFFLNSHYLFEPKFLILLVISTIGMYGIGYIIAGISLIHKKTSDILPIFQYLIFALVAIPIKENPFLMLIPIYNGSSLIKLNILKHSISLFDWLQLLMVSFLNILIGIVIFSLCEKYCRKKGVFGK
jgi:ABC-2 type transport system permease protein